MRLPTIDAALESGNAAVTSSVDGTVRLQIPPDPGGSRHWFHFRAGPTPGPVPFRLEGLADTTYAAGWAHSRLWARSSGQGWREQPQRFDGDALIFEHAPGEGWTEYAPSVPCRMADIAAVEAAVLRAGARVDVLGHSQQGREIRVLRLTQPGRRRRQAWIVAGQHAGEMPALWFALGIAERLLASASPLDGWDVHIVPVANPDGHAHGWQRSDAAGRDLNREWSAERPAPEVEAIRRAMTAGGVDLCVDVHSDAVLPYVYVDDVDAFVGATAAATRCRRAFEDAFAAATADFQTARRYPWASVPPRAEVLKLCGPWAQQRFGALAFTLELPTSWHDARPELGGWSPARSRALAAALLSSVETVP